MNVGKTNIRNNEIRNNAPVPQKYVNTVQKNAKFTDNSPITF